MKNRFLLLSIFLMVLSSFNVLGFAVTSYYWNEKPLFLNPGETKSVQAFGLQNMAGDEDIYVKVNQVSGFTIASITDKSDIYGVPLGRKDVFVNVEINIPKDAKIGETHEIAATFKESSDKGDGNIRFTSGMQSSIFIVVGKVIDEIGQEVKQEEILLPSGPTKTEELVNMIQKRSTIVGPAILLLILIAIILIYRYELRKNKQ